MDWVSGQDGWKKGLNHSTQKLVFNGPKWNWDVGMSGVPQGWVGRLNWMTSRGPELFCDSVIKSCRASSSIGSFRFLWINGLGCSPGTAESVWCEAAVHQDMLPFHTLLLTTRSAEMSWPAVTSSQIQNTSIAWKQSIPCCLTRGLESTKWKWTDFAGGLLTRIIFYSRPTAFSLKCSLWVPPSHSYSDVWLFSIGLTQSVSLHLSGSQL